jgi:hypothetical protein
MWGSEILRRRRSPICILANEVLKQTPVYMSMGCVQRRWIACISPRVRLNTASNQRKCNPYKRKRK